jgi:hypothetical protein
LKKKSWLFTVGLGLKFEVVFRIGFLANFHNILELNIIMQQELTQKNAKQLNISNLTKENEIHETKPEKIRNETKFYF